ncbi:GNAT family N-acetyltransferase [Ruegeria sp. A3M17]|uniref:GNAT family N-acetyltransferase n=1 Tax=Ruegeria sp. A3M17 TaxID=2267229 RepID=UPI000DE820A0|nr:GNAT family N-acetyltransferase [Ruegeria sp. A3M17]RBW59048.1 GNAT family N-acetyltransferase [Ruegeria sp. A3M17]
MKIRQAKAADAKEIAAITNAIIRDTLVTFTTDERSVEGIARDIEARGPAYLVAEQDDQILGFATYGPFRSGPGYAQCRELTIQLAIDARGQGTGRALMRALEAAARAEGTHALVAGISLANPGAVSFHAAVGFVEVGRMPEVGFKWGKRLDLVLMQKILATDGLVAPDSPDLGR